MSPDITSPGNERIKWLERLRDRRHRDEEGVFLVEGQRLYRRALDAGLYPVLTFVSAEDDIGGVGRTLTVAPAALDRASYRRRSQGIIAVFPQLDNHLDSLRVPEAPLLLIAEDIEKPGNLGAMLRTAAAAGADALIAVGARPDPHNPNVLRASTGALFTMPLAVCDWDRLEPWLALREVRVIAASPGARTPVWETDLSGAVAIVVGAEDEGLSTRAESVAVESTLIPHVPDRGVDSLNVSVAAAVLLFEARRQRG